MVLRALLERLLNHPQIIDKLANSAPIRQAAKVTASAIVDGQAAAQEVYEKTVKEITAAKEHLEEIEKKQKAEQEASRK